MHRIARITLAAVSLTLPVLAAANDSTEHLASEVGKFDCARLDATMPGFLKQNREHIASLHKLAPGVRVRELESYRKALMRAEDVAARCAAGKPSAEAKLTAVGANPNHIVGFYPKLNATIDYVLNSNSSDPYVYQQLTRSYDELLDAYRNAKK